MLGPVDCIARWLGEQADTVVVAAPPDLPSEAAAEEEDRGLVDLQCGKAVIRNVPARMRTDMWLSQLPGTGTAATSMRQYQKLLAQVCPLWACQPVVTPCARCSLCASTAPDICDAAGHEGRGAGRD